MNNVNLIARIAIPNNIVMNVKKVFITQYKTKNVNLVIKIVRNAMVHHMFSVFRVKAPINFKTENVLLNLAKQGIIEKKLNVKNMTKHAQNVKVINPMIAYPVPLANILFWDNAFMMLVVMVKEFLPKSNAMMVMKKVETAAT